MKASSSRALRHGLAALGLALVAAAPAMAGRAGVTASPSPADRAALDNMFLNGGTPVRFVFSPAFRERIRSAAAAPAATVPPAPESSFHGVPAASYRFGGGGEAALAALIDAAQKSVHLAAPSFACAQVAEALVRAKRRGVDARLLTEHRRVDPATRPAEMQTVIFGDVGVRTLSGDGPLGALRGAFVLLDGQLLETGSPGWGERASAHEGMALRDDPSLVAGFSSYWGWMWSQAKPLSGLAVEAKDTVPFEEPQAALSFKGKSWPAWALPAKGTSDERLLAAVKLCRTSVDLVLPGLTRQAVEAVASARKEGAAVRVVTDRDLKPDLLDALRAAGAAVSFYDGALGAQFAVLDNELVESGSYAPAGEGFSGFGPAVFSDSPADLKGYAAEFAYLLGQAR